MTYKTKRLTAIAILTALYFVLSALLKIPVGGHITLDLGYIALTVGAAFLGAVPGMFIGAVGALLESMILSQRGISVGWIIMNAIVGFSCGKVMHRTLDDDRKKFILSSVIVVLVSMLPGCAVKMFLDCIIYNLPVVLKIPTTLIAYAADSAVMLLFGVPLCLSLRGRLKLEE